MLPGGFVAITKVFKSTYVHLHRMLDYFTCYNSDNSSFELRSWIQQEPLSVYGHCTSMLEGVKQRISCLSTMLPITLRWPPRPIMCSCKPFSEDGYGLGSSSNLRWPGCSCFGTLCARDWFVGLLKRWGTKNWIDTLKVVWRVAASSPSPNRVPYYMWLAEALQP